MSRAKNQRDMAVSRVKFTRAMARGALSKRSGKCYLAKVVASRRYEEIILLILKRIEANFYRRVYSAGSHVIVENFDI